MTQLLILKGTTNPELRAHAEDVGEITDDVKALAQNMLDTMLAEDGVGLAAPQVGSHFRMILVTLGFETKRERAQILINPVIDELSIDEVVIDEGCLSLPGVYAKVRRPKDITITYTKLSGERLTESFKGFDSRVIQHEIDHLNGILFTDRSLAQGFINDMQARQIEKKILGLGKML